eukprot:5860-Heterococcus_DN1.PRE.1
MTVARASTSKVWSGHCTEQRTLRREYAREDEPKAVNRLYQLEYCTHHVKSTSSGSDNIASGHEVAVFRLLQYQLQVKAGAIHSAAAGFFKISAMS